jgi:type III secretion protein X
MSRINLLDPSLGIQNVMDMPTESVLPRARDMGANALSEPGLEELYAPSNARRYVETLLCPDVGDGSILSPESFSDNIDGVIQELASNSDPAVKEMLVELKALNRNGQLYQAYMGLMIGG